MTDHPSIAQRFSVFATTRWSVVLSAGQSGAPEQEVALSYLCQTYWYPLYAYVRRRGFGHDDAQDLTQSFFALFLEKDNFGRADRERGRFRTFLLHSIENFLNNEWVRTRAQKRGGGREVVSWDNQTAEDRYRMEPVEQMTPARLFEKRWATTLLDEVLEKLREEAKVNSRTEFFDAIRPHLWGDVASTPYAELAGQLNMTPGALKVAVHRFRQRYRELLRSEIAHTLADPREVDDEIRHLIQVLSE